MESIEEWRTEFVNHYKPKTHRQRLERKGTNWRQDTCGPPILIQCLFEETMTHHKICKSKNTNKIYHRYNYIGNGALCSMDLIGGFFLC